MILILDTTRYGEIRVAVQRRTLKSLVKRFDGPVRGQLLTVVDELLRREGENVSALTGIVVAIGPGPFSALRSAAALANALVYVLHIPAVGVRGEHTLRALAVRGAARLRRATSGAIVVPFYGRPPHITKSKHR